MALEKKIINIDQLKLLAQKVKEEDTKVTTALEAKISALKLSQLENDKTFQTKAEIQALIAAADHLQRKIVENVEAIKPEEPGADKYIYLVKNESEIEQNGYDEYMVVEGAVEKVGDWKVDLSDYVKNDALDSKLGSYVTSDSLTSTLSPYAKTTEVDTKLKNYVKTETLAGYVTTDALEEYVTDEELTAKGYATTAAMTEALSSKVDTVLGKQLSTEDYTTAEQTKLAGIQDGATKVEKSEENGKIKINGKETEVYTLPATVLQQTDVADDASVTSMLEEVFNPEE